tara:strand:+ start:913 stop:1230 length:318 start_codon:yes stop_codon:yes gene_type:complete
MTDEINFSYTEILKRKIDNRLRSAWKVEVGYAQLKGLKKETLEDLDKCLNFYEDENKNNPSVNYEGGYAIQIIRSYRSLEIYEKQQKQKRELEELQELEELDIKE